MIKPMHMFWVVLAVRYFNADSSIIPDCDEVFNYWEPTHYLTNGFGLQTWEYSPVYAIRSWAYVSLHAAILKVISIVLPLLNKTALQNAPLYLLRGAFIQVSAGSEIALYAALRRSKLFGPGIALAYIAISLLSPGMSHASVSYLPSSFAMHLFTISLSFLVNYLSAETNRARVKAISYGLFTIVVGGVLGWPFVLALAPPWAFHFLYTTVTAPAPATDEKKLTDKTQTTDLTPYRAFFSALGNVVLASTILIALIVGIDALAYRKIEFVPLNIVLYNVVHASADSGPNIFGTEPWHYYFANLALNFNIALPLALAAPLALPFSSIRKKRSALLLLLPFFLWLTIFSAQPHKEERFMYIIYGALAVNAAVTIDAIARVVTRIVPCWPCTGIVAATAVLLVYGALAVMRTSALIVYYGAPMRVYAHARELAPPEHTAAGGANSNVCVGREWYRFPSSYFLRDDQRIKFIASGFDGLLPGEFAEEGSLQNWRPGTHMLPHGMNNRNQADPGKLVPVAACDYVVDTDLETAPNETHFTRDEAHWRKVFCAPFLDAGASRGIARLLNLPPILQKLTKSELVWTEYCLLERISETEPLEPEKAV